MTMIKWQVFEVILTCLSLPNVVGEGDVTASYRKTPCHNNVSLNLWSSMTNKTGIFYWNLHSTWIYKSLNLPLLAWWIHMDWECVCGQEAKSVSYMKNKGQHDSVTKYIWVDRKKADAWTSH